MKRDMEESINQMRLRLERSKFQELNSSQVTTVDLTNLIQAIDNAREENTKFKTVVTDFLVGSNIETLYQLIGQENKDGDFRLPSEIKCEKLENELAELKTKLANMLPPCDCGRYQRT